MRLAMKRFLSLFCILMLLCSCALCEAIEIPLPDNFFTPEPTQTPVPTQTPAPAATPSPTKDPYSFAIRYGDRSQPRIAITMDDCYEREWVRKTFELCQQYGVTCTFFPLGDTLLEEEADLWREIIAGGFEIGSHTAHHTYLGKHPNDTVIAHILLFQEKLDNILGFHYGVNCLRPPFGNYEDKDGNKNTTIRLIRRAGFEHVVLWDVIDTDPDKALKNTKNGSILLYHARKADYNCLVKLIPALIDKGFELVTLSDLLGFGPIEISDELFDYRKEDYR